MLILGKDKTPTIEDGNGRQQLEIPQIMTGDKTVVGVIQDFRNDMQRSNRSVEMSKYVSMEGMQSRDKVDFFTEFTNDDDVLRMNTIQSFVTIMPLTIRKTSDKNMIKIKGLLNDVYTGHVNTHKTNMVSKNRKREESYVKILSSDSSDSGVVPTGIKKFFGIGGKGK